MKKILTRKFWTRLIQILFWVGSINLWSIVLNPGVDSIGVFGGLVAGWDTVLLLNTVMIIYISLPLIWLLRKVKIGIKLLLTLLFLAPIGIVIFQAIAPTDDKELVDIFVDYFFRNFMYVIVFHLTIAAAVYLHTNQLILKYLNQSLFRKYLLQVVGLIAGAAIINYCIFNYFLDKLFPNLYYISYFKIWELALIIFAYLLFTGGLFLTGQYARMLIEKREAARNELSALKAQINPHFLFNNLNTIYSMASQKDDRTPETVLKLSDFLRYILYDTSGETIPLQKEVEIIETYISLQKERINPEITSVELETEGNFSEVRIAPLLLLPLVENCFKHGVGKSKGEIKIHIEFEDKYLRFRTFNTVALRETSHENGGIGIANVEKRLNLIYPDRHSIEFQEKDGLFWLEMKIQLA